MKKMVKVSLILILILSFIFAVFQTISNAEDSSYSDMMGKLITEDYKDTTGTDQKVGELTDSILISLRVVGVCVAIVMLLTIAMKYMMAAPGDKADIKKSAVQYIVGAVVLFGAVGILTIISNFSSNIKAG